MARINLARRAQIGQEKRTRTRAQIVAAACALFASRAVESVTVDDVVTQAGVAKGTFYVHFDDLAALTTAVADQLIASFDEVLQAERLSISDPLTRIAFGCDSFIAKALDDAAWANLTARIARSDITVGSVARSRLRKDLKRALENLGPHAPSLDLALEAALGVMLQTLAAFGEGRLPPGDREPAVAAVLRAIGADARRVTSTQAQLARIAKTETEPTSSARRAAKAAPATAARTGRRARIDVT